jgi:hypothetical protein
MAFDNLTSVHEVLRKRIKTYPLAKTGLMGNPSRSDKGLHL